MASNEEGRQINKLSPGVKIPHSHFTLNKRFGVTTVFGKNVPIYAKEFVTDDGPITIEPNCDIRSYTLKAPMIGTIQKHVSAYQVPLQAILPFNWEKIVKNPNRGSDVVGFQSVSGLIPAKDVNTVIPDFFNKVYDAFFSDFSEIAANYPLVPTVFADMNDYLRDLFGFIIKYELFFSQGSLIALLGAHFGQNFTIKWSVTDIEYSFDEFTEIILSNILGVSFKVYDYNGNKVVATNKGAKHIRQVLDFMRSNQGIFTFDTSSIESPTNEVDFDDCTLKKKSDFTETESYNYGRCCAYQLVNAHFFTNDKIDYINTAELYRQHVSSLYSQIDSFETFEYNGVLTQYDYLCGKYVTTALSAYLYTPVNDSSFYSFLYPYISAIFGFNYSLRYMDYFVGARPKNLAVGDTSIRVDNNTVQVVDVTKNIVKQRFLNSVARIGNTIEEYSDKILGRRLEYDYHNPKFLFSFDADVFTTEVENTAEAQQEKPNSVTAVMRGNFKNHRFTFSVDRFSYVILIEYADFARFYYTTQERATMAIDRFDMFVPELQYVGDQELRRSELFAGYHRDDPFGYQLRDMQFKQAYDECAGGFVDFLPGWLFKFNPYDCRYDRSIDSVTISPSFIRSVPQELDDFYLSLTNMSLAGYFHFIEMWDIKVSAKRPMAYAPQIL